MATDNFTAIDTELDALRKVMHPAPAIATPSVQMVSIPLDILQDFACVSAMFRDMCAAGQIKSIKTLTRANRTLAWVEAQQ